MKPFIPSARTGRSSSAGSALIICLILVVMVTVLVVGMTTTARMERVTVAAYQATQEAGFLARMGAHVAMARIAEATDATASWSSAPGVILRYDSAASDPTEILLYSGSTSEIAEDISVNLNPPALVQLRGLILKDPAIVMAQQWIYLRQDGTFLPAGEVPVYSETNPAIGRFAFWTDDAASRININTAWTRRSANLGKAGHPSKIELAAASPLTEAMVDAMNDFRVNHGALATPGEMRTVSTGADTAFSNAPEVFTHYNHASLLTPWGEPRYFLTTQTGNLASGEKRFFDILKTGSSSPAKVSSLDPTKVSALFKELYTLLSRKDWPMMPERSFVDKYGAKGAAQIALNLIDAVRSAESPTVLVEPLRGTFNATAGTFTVESSATVNTLMGNARRPLLTEMAVSVPLSKVTENEGGSAKSYYLCQAYAEIYLPESAGGAIDLVADNYTLHVVNFAGTGAANESAIAAAEIRGGQPSRMEPGEYRTVIRTVKVPASATSSPPVAITLRMALSIGSQRIDIAPLPSATPIAYTAAPGAPEAVLRSYAVDDPHVKHHLSDWKEGPQTFDGPPANRALGQSASGTPIQDHDLSGNVVADSVVFPARGTGVNGMADLLGKLHSGMVGQGVNGGIPWRTLRFQPSGATADELPDWLLLELFASPLGTAGAVAGIYPLDADQTNGFEARGGLLNVNSLLTPFTHDDEALARDLPLRSLLTGTARFSTESVLNTAVENIRERTAATEGKLYGRDRYVFPGELAEIAGVADSGEASEAGLIQIVEQATTRSGTFIVYSIGESLRQGANGRITPTGRKQMLYLVEKAKGDMQVVYQEELGL